MGKRGVGRPEIELTPEQLKIVQALAECGVRQDRIAAKVGISESSLKRKCKDILKRGRLIWECDYEESLRTQVLKARCSATLKIFMAKVGLGYREEEPDTDEEKRRTSWTYRETARGERIKPEPDGDFDDEAN